MGSGKSAIGKKLAESLGFPFADIDYEIEKRENKRISEIFTSKGEIYFRKVENSTLKHLLSNDQNIVLATGGGTPCYADSMSYMNSQKNITTIYLKTSLGILTKRLFSEKTERPLLSHLDSEENLNDFIRKHLFERAFYYNQADFIIENTNETINVIVKKIILKLF